MRLRSDDEVNAAFHVLGFDVHARQHRAVHRVHAAKQLGAEVRVLAQIENRLVETRDHAGGQSVGQVVGHGFAALFVGRGGTRAVEGARDGVVRQRGVGLHLVQFADDELERLGQLGRALGVIVEPAVH